MSFKEDHPEYKKYESSDLHYSDLPYSFSWSALESLVDEAGGPDRESLAKVVQKIATKTRAGNVTGGNPYDWIRHVVSKIRERVNEGKFYTLMDCLAILCDDGELTTDTLNEFLEDYSIGYRAYGGNWMHSVSWEKVESDDKDEESDEQLNISEDNALLLLGNAEIVTSKEQLKKAKDKMKNAERDEIFISHRTVDAAFADMILDYLSGCEVPKNKIFCSSLPGNDVDERISPEVKQHLKKAAIIILILSNDYYKSAYCINEAGVAWYLDEVASIIPIGLPEINHGDMVGFLGQNYKLRRLDNDDDIAFLFDKAHEKLNSGTNKHGIITRETKKLKERYRQQFEGRELKETSSHDKVKDGDNFDFGDEDEKLQRSDNPTVQAIIDAGGVVNGIASIVSASGLSEATVKRKIKEALDNGEIEVVGAARHKTYRVVGGNCSIPVVGKDDVGNIPVDSALLLVFAAADNGQIIKVQSLGSPVQVSAAGKQFMADNSQRESARWVEALDRLISWGWVKSVGSKGQIFELTGTGYQKADWLKEGMDINTNNEPLDELKQFGG